MKTRLFTLMTLIVGLTLVMLDSAQSSATIGVSYPLTNTAYAPGEQDMDFGSLTIETAQHIISDATWQYSKDLVAGWTEITFDDSAWSYVEAPSAGLCDLMPEHHYIVGSDAQPMWAEHPQEYETIYVRRSFHLEAVSQATMAICVDDDYDLYVNGTLVASDWDGYATSCSGPHYYDVTSYLAPGTNVIAIKARDTYGVCQHITLDLAVRAGDDSPPGVGTFEPDGGSGRVGEWADFTTTYSDPSGYDDIEWAFFFLDRQLPIARDGLAAAYHQPSNVLWLWGGGLCVPGQAQFRTTDYITLDCGNSSVSAEGDTLTINWHVRPEQCFIGGCGLNMAYEFVTDSTWQWDAAVVGTWTLNPVSGAAQETGPAVKPTEADLERLIKEIKVWLSGLGEP